MEVTERPDELSARTEAARRDGRRVGFVPTMGFLHEGHLSLVRRARESADLVVVSIFVNPLQFGPAEDLEQYPRDLDRDLALLDRERVDVVVAPPVEAMYPRGRPSTTVDPGHLGERLEGASRPGHFRGVATVVAKLFAIVGPCAAFFGEKDAQQLAVVRRMVADLSLPVEVVGCPVVREADGLAMSSRNVFLSPPERRAATCLSRGLRAARDAYLAGERSGTGLRGAIEAAVAAEPLASLDYAAVVEEDTFEEVGEARGPVRGLVAAKVGRPRLIDTMLLGADNEGVEAQV